MKKIIKFESDYDLTESIRKDNPLQRETLTKMDRVSEEKSDSFGKKRISAWEKSKLLKRSSVDANYWVQIGPTCIPDSSTTSMRYYSYGFISLNEIKTTNVTGRVTSIVIDPFDDDSKTIYVGTALGGIWKTTDGGRNWFATSDKTESLAIGTITIHPTNQNILYAGTGESNFSSDSYYGVGLLKTIDGGNHWNSCGEKQRQIFLNSRFCRIIFDPKINTTLFAAVRSSEYSSSASGIYKSSDEGVNWTRLDKDLPGLDYNFGAEGATDIVIISQNPNIAYVSFYGDNVYKTTDLGSEQPSWIKQKLPGFSASRICLAMSKFFPDILYVLATDKNGSINQLYRTKNAQSLDSETTWEKIEFPKSNNETPWEDETIGDQGSYNLYIEVDPKNPDVIYLAGISLWKVIYNNTTKKWNFRDIGKQIHSDNHVIAFDPKNNFILYVGNDGGIYKSTDTGETWDDKINEGLCITQFEFMSNHPTSDAVFFAGSQDNGTLQFRNSPVFVASDYGDGGFVSIDHQEPSNIIHQYTYRDLFHSNQGGKKDSWIKIKVPNCESSFYAPFTLDQENPKNIAFGASDRICFDNNQGLNGWKKFNGENDFILLPGMIKSYDWVTSLNYVNSKLIYVGTNHGKIFRLTKYENNWNKPELLYSPVPDTKDSPPDRWIWDIASYPEKDQTFLVAMAGLSYDFVTGSHLWRGNISKTGNVVWEDVTPKDDNNEIIDIPVFSVAIDTQEPNNIYIGTDVGVFKTTDNCKTWELFNEGLPNCPIFDMRILYEPKKMLRAVTHGRGAWEILLDGSKPKEVDIFVRDHLMDTGRHIPSYTWEESVETCAAFEDPLQHEDISKSILLGSKLSWYMSPDIKVDSPIDPNSTFQFDSDDVDYVVFENKLFHRNLKRARINHIFVQIHNRGSKCAGLAPKDKIMVKLLYADVVSKNINNRQYHDLPDDFWSKFPDNSLDTSCWKPIGEVKFLPDPPKTLSNTEPTILEWDWNVPPDIGNLIWLLVIIDSTEDPIQESNKSSDLQNFVRNEKHIAVRVVNVNQI